MPRYELLDAQGNVINTIVADANYMTEHYAPAEYREAPDSPEPTPSYGTRITRLAFRNRFTGPEKVALYNAAKVSVELQIYLDDLAAATYVDLANAETIAGVNALVGAGLLTSQRATAILTDPVQSGEVPAAVAATV